MQRRYYYLPFLLFAFIIRPFWVDAANWTDWDERKLGRIIIKANKAARKKEWEEAISYGEKMLKGSLALDKKSSLRYIILLKNLNYFYSRSNRIHEVPHRVKQGYDLSRKYLGIAHETTIIERNLYYRLLVKDKNYAKAIELVLESMEIAGDTIEENFKRLHYFKQLYSLYGITRQLEKEEDTLKQYLALSRELVGEHPEDTTPIIKALAQNYCHRRLLDHFKTLVTEYQLPYICE